jgi:methylmalonyl-CoA/ethylmalonyl-CoA epimerase
MLARMPLTELLAARPIVQVAVIVSDLEHAVRAQSSLLGIGPWRVYEFGPHMMRRYELRGEPARGRTLLALNGSQPQMEVLQPLSPGSLHHDWLEQRGECLHHVGLVVDSVAEVERAAVSDGVEVLSSGEGFGADGDGRFAYLDTQAQLGLIVEVFEPPASLGEPLRRL